MFIAFVKVVISALGLLIFVFYFRVIEQNKN